MSLKNVIIIKLMFTMMKKKRRAAWDAATKAMKRLIILVCIVLLNCVLAGCGGSSEQATGSESASNASDYPSKPITVIVPFGAGGGTDLVARILANYLPKYLPNEQQVVVVNMEGGTATIGTTEALSSAPDGYTLEYSIVSPLAIQPLFGETSYTAADARPIIRVQDTPMVLTVKSDSKWQTVHELISDAVAEQGQISCAVTGNGSLQHLGTLELSREAGVEFKIVSFTSDTDMMAALVGGHVDCAVAQAHGAKAQVDAGGARILMNMSETKLSYLQDIPTAAESGYKLTLSAFSGFYGPRDLPDDIVAVMHDAVNRCLDDDEVITALSNVGVEPAYADAATYEAEILECSETAKELLRNLGMISE
jgi:tripartite-type tricarboxylate transporter receptor subunit TctC